MLFFLLFICLDIATLHYLQTASGISCHLLVNSPNRSAARNAVATDFVPANKCKKKFLQVSLEMFGSINGAKNGCVCVCVFGCLPNVED